MRVLVKRARDGTSPVVKDLSVVKNKPPDCSKGVASPRRIWSLDRKFHSILVNGVTDPDGDKVAIKVMRFFIRMNW
jgi:hypothetical protein